MSCEASHPHPKVRRLAAAPQEKALGLAQTETLPDLSEAEVRDIKRRTVR